MPRDKNSRIRFEMILGISSILIIAGSLGPWYSLAMSRYFVLETWHAVFGLMGGFLSLFAAIFSHPVIDWKSIQNQRPHINAGLGGVGGIWAILSSVIYWLGLETNTVPKWGLFITIIGGLLALLSSIGIYSQAPYLNKNKSSI